MCVQYCNYRPSPLRFLTPRTRRLSCQQLYGCLCRTLVLVAERCHSLVHSHRGLPCGNTNNSHSTPAKAHTRTLFVPVCVYATSLPLNTMKQGVERICRTEQQEN